MKWSFAQTGLLIISTFHAIQAVIGFIAEPSFAVGPDADFNQDRVINSEDLFGFLAVFFAGC